MANITEKVIELLHLDPTNFEDAPSDGEIIAGNPDLKNAGLTELSPAVRAGFLQMWHMSETRRDIADLSDAELDNIKEDYKTYMDNRSNEPDPVCDFDMRFIYTIAQNASAIREIRR